MLRVIFPFHLQVKQLCLGLPCDLTSLDGKGLDEFMGCKEHLLARMLRDLFCKETVRFLFCTTAPSEAQLPVSGSPTSSDSIRLI